jgi:hypothetical protein
VVALALAVLVECELSGVEEFSPVFVAVDVDGAVVVSIEELVGSAVV